MTNAERDRVIAEYLEPGQRGGYEVDIGHRPGEYHQEVREVDDERKYAFWPDYSDARNWARLLDLANIEIQISLIPSCPKWRAVSNSGAVDFFFEGEILGEVVPNCAYAIAVAANNEKEGNDG